MYDATSWLLDPLRGLQLGTTESIDENRAALLRGNVYDRDTGFPLAGVRVSVVGRPGAGEARTRQTSAHEPTGNYELLVNGGGPFTLQFEAPGHLTAQRTIDVPWNDWVRVPDVALVPSEELTCGTSVNMTGTTGVMVPGPPRTEGTATRQTAVWLPAQTYVRSGGAGTPTPAYQLCMGEYTRVGATEDSPVHSREDAMPAELPGSTSFTFAAGVEVWDASHASQISEPQFVSAGGVPTSALLYVRVADPILPSTPGDIVPNGSYDLGRTSWASEENGRIIAVTGSGVSCTVDTGGVVLIPAMTGDEQAALCALGAGTYYRVPVHHFSLVDLNWLAQVLGLIPRDSTSAGGSNPNCSGGGHGSIIYCDRAALGERFALTGTPYSLMYLSHRQAGRREQWRARVQPAPADHGTCAFHGTRVHLELLVAGTRARQPSGAGFVERLTLPPGAACTPTDLVWDGTNAYGQSLVGPQRAYVRIGYEFDLRYLAMSGGAAETCEGGTITCDVGAHCDAMTDTCVNESSFASVDPSVTTAEMVNAHTVIAWITRRVTVGTIDDHLSSLGGIGIDAHHFYDPATSTLFMGDGSERSVESSANTLRTVAVSERDDGIPAVAVGPNGDLYYFDADPSSQHLRVVPAGASLGSAEDVGTETFDNVQALAIGRAPSLGRDVLYVLEGERSTDAAPGHGCVIYRVDPTARGSASVIGVLGQQNECGSAGLPRLRRPIRLGDLSLSRSPSALSVASDGSLFFVSDGQLMRIVDTGVGGQVEDLFDGAVGAMSLGPDGTLYFAADGCVSGGSEHCIAQRRPDGVITTAIAPGPLDVNDGAQACSDPAMTTDACARLGIIRGLALDVDRRLCWSEAASTAPPTHPGRVRCVRPGSAGDVERIYTVAGLRSDITPPSPSSPSSATLAPATRVDLGLIGALARSPDGRLYVVDGLGASALGGQSRVMVVEPTLDGDLTADHIIASSDGTMLYRFNGAGRHLSTVDALSGEVQTSFEYIDDPTSPDFGRLIGIIDAERRRTTIDRDPQHVVITAPGGVTTRLTLGGDDGYVATVEDPASSAWSLEYTSLPGLLTQLTDARHFVHMFAYDDGPGASGRLLSDTRPPADAVSAAATLSLQLPASIPPDAMDPDDVPWSEVAETEAPDAEIASVASQRMHYRVRGLASGVLEREVVRGDSTAGRATQIHASVPSDGSAVTTSLPDGSTVISVFQPDPRPIIGMDSPYPASTVVTRPSGSTTSIDRAIDNTGGVLTETTTIRGDLATPDGTADMVLTRADRPSSAGRVVTTMSPAGHPDRMVTISRQGTRITRVDLPGQGPVCFFYPDTTSHRATIVQRMPFAESLCNAPDPSGAMRQVRLTYSDGGSSSSPRWLRTITAGTGATTLATSITPDSRGWPSSIGLPGRSHPLVPIFDAHANLTSFQPPGNPAHTFTYTQRDSLDTYTSPGGLESRASTYRPDGRLSGRAFAGSTGDRSFAIHVSPLTGYMSSVVTGGDGPLNDTIQIAADPTVGGRPTALLGSMDAVDLDWDGSVLTDQLWTTGGTLSAGDSHVFGGTPVARVQRAVDGRMLLTDERACVGSSCSMPASGHVVHYGYDDGRLLTSAGMPTLVGATIDYVFNPHNATGGLLSGSTVTTTTGDLVTEMNATTLGELDHIVATDSHGSGAASLVYSTQICARDALGRITRRVEAVNDGRGRASLVAWDYEYDARGFLSRAVSATPPSGNPCAAERPRPRSRTLSDQSFTYDEAGNRSDLAVGTAGDDRARVDGRQYNPMGQLTQVNTLTGGPFGGTRTFAYDVLGRLRATTQHNPSPPSGTPAEITTTYESDPFGRLMAITPGTGSAVQAQRFAYRDALEPIAWQRPTRATRCAGRTDTAYFVYATSRHTPDLMYVDECDGDGTVERAYRVLYDERGSVRLIVDLASGAVAQRIDYDVWGRPTFVPAASEGFQPFGFIGGIWDGETGFWRLGARDYDPRIGRWTTEDPLGVLGGTNLYAYCMNDAVNCADPSGLLGPLGSGLLSGACAGALGLDLTDVLIAAAVGAAFVAMAPATLTAAAVYGAALGVAGGLASDYAHDRMYRWGQGSHTLVYVAYLGGGGALGGMLGFGAGGGISWGAQQMGFTSIAEWAGAQGFGRSIGGSLVGSASGVFSDADFGFEPPPAAPAGGGSGADGDESECGPQGCFL